MQTIVPKKSEEMKRFSDYISRAIKRHLQKCQVPRTRESSTARVQRRQCTDEGSRLRPNNLVFWWKKITSDHSHQSGAIWTTRMEEKINLSKHRGKKTQIFQGCLLWKWMKIVKKLMVNQGLQGDGGHDIEVKWYTQIRYPSGET